MKYVLALTLALTLAASHALAQLGGGGGAGALQGLLQFFLQNIAPGLGIAGIALAGVLCLGARLGLVILCGIVIGIYVMNNAEQIYTIISGGR